MEFQKEIEIYFRSRFTLIVVVSFEEERIIEEIKQVCENSRRQLFVWDHADFFQSFTKNVTAPAGIKDPLSALETIEKLEGETVFILRDFHQCWQGQARIIQIGRAHV